ncbi:MAG: HAMP domain-containing sensor histidine kinase [Dysgonomonas sp.]
MKPFKNNLAYRYLFVIVAMFIAVGSLVVSHFLVADLSREETNKMKIWAEATKEAAGSDDNVNMNLIVQILESNTTIPVILHDKKDNFYTSVNIELPPDEDQKFLEKKASSFAKRHEPIVIEATDFEQFLYYDDSYTLKRLQIYPYIQLGVLTIFVITSLLALLSTKRLEQDRLWVGLSKETAHQLGTPLSSLLAWLEYLRMKEVEPSIVNDMEKDVSRLQMITDRFSKIGSAPVLERRDIVALTRQTISYLEKRISKKVPFYIDFPQEPLYANISEPLFSWVIENLTKNAVDAMSGIGQIHFILLSKDQTIYLDICDTGKGIPKSNFKTVFNTGYTTKARGWGLGLSLAKRIVQSYHKGKIYVKSSEINVGTVFRIELKKIE